MPQLRGAAPASQQRHGDTALPVQRLSSNATSPAQPVPGAETPSARPAQPAVAALAQPLAAHPLTAALARPPAAAVPAPQPVVPPPPAVILVEVAGSGGLLIPVVVVQDGALAAVGVGAITAGIALLATTGSGPKKSGPWTAYARSAGLQIPNQLPDNKCPLDGQIVDGPSVSGSNEAAACLAAKHAFNAMMPRGCRPKHMQCKCTKR